MCCKWKKVLQHIPTKVLSNLWTMRLLAMPISVVGAIATILGLLQYFCDIALG